MNAEIAYLMNKTSATQIAEHLSRCDADFVPSLSSRVKIGDYARKIANRATRFEAWSGSTLVGLVAAYCNDRTNRVAYITSVSVLREWTGKGIAAHLMNQCVEHAKASGMRRIRLEVAADNTPAIKLYEESGFVAGKATAPSVTMDLTFERRGRT
jgi:ribosomal protein S18 acetylase RimI-like enzyme